MGDGGALNGDPLARELSGAGRKSADQAQVGEWPPASGSGGGNGGRNASPPMFPVVKQGESSVTLAI